MKKVAALSVLLVLGSAAAVADAQQKDAAGCADHPLFPTRMPNYRIEKCETRDFDFFDFYVTKGPKTHVEGKLTKITYAVGDKKDDRSGLEVTRNYENALKKIGGQSGRPTRRAGRTARLSSKAGRCGRRSRRATAGSGSRSSRSRPWPRRSSRTPPPSGAT